jgi:nitrite reductase/ring-hydroxylating ferredoxin subunit
MGNDEPGFDRRTMLRTTAAVAAGGVTAAGLAACSGSSTSAVTSTTATPACGSGTAPAGTVLGAATDIAVGSGKIFTDQKVVVTHPDAGTYKGFSSICTHKGCEVGKVQDNVIVCTCHGSQFSASDGSVKNGPASAPLPRDRRRVGRPDRAGRLRRCRTPSSGSRCISLVLHLTVVLVALALVLLLDLLLKSLAKHVGWRARHGGAA